MEHKLDLSQYQIRTDLAVESLKYNKNTIKPKIETDAGIKITTIKVDDQHEKIVQKPAGLYITLEFDDVSDFDQRQKIIEVLKKQVQKMLKFKNIDTQASCLIVGLGNESSTPDSLGPLVIDKLLVTRHLFLLNMEVKEGIRNVSAIKPSVTGKTGIETTSVIKNIVLDTKPDFLIVVDALAASTISHINKTIQITDSGIIPGSGVGNIRESINSNNLGVPVIALGIPTVVDTATIVSDTLNYLLQHISYIKNNYQTNKLTFKHDKNYSNSTRELDIEEKKELLGIVGTMSEDNKKRLLCEVLRNVEYNLIVTDKEIDFVLKNLSLIISSGINLALHRQVTHNNCL